MKDDRFQLILADRHSVDHGTCFRLRSSCAIFTGCEFDSDEVWLSLLVSVLSDDSCSEGTDYDSVISVGICFALSGCSHWDYSSSGDFDGYSSDSSSGVLIFGSTNLNFGVVHFGHDPELFVSDEYYAVSRVGSQCLSVICLTAFLNLVNSFFVH